MTDKKSKSEQFLDNKFSLKPIATATMAKSVSEYRRQTLSEEVKQGKFRDGKTGIVKAEEDNYISGAVGRKKTAQVLSSGTDSNSIGIAGGKGGYSGSNDTFRTGPEIYSPLWLTSNLSLPRDRATVNAWCRAFFALNPIVQNAISLHSTYPISKLNIKCADKKIERFFNEMCEEIDLINICVQVAQEYWLLGESFVFAEYDNNKGKWSRLLLQNPDFMAVQNNVMSNEPIIMLRPDEHLKKIVTSNKAEDVQQRRQLNQYIIDCVKRGQNIQLDNFNVSHLARKISPYEIRGTGLPVSVFRSLMLYDQLRESKFAQAAGMVNPTTIVKVGSPEFKAPPEYMEQVRNTFEMAQFDKDFKIFTQHDINVERVGFGQGIYDISGDITQLMKEVYIGLMVPSVLMDGGADVTYANGGVALDVLRQRYMAFREMMSRWLRNKIFAPISKIQGFYDYTGGEKKLIVPEIDWNHMSLFDAGDYISTLKELTAGEGDAKRVSIHTLYKSLGLEFEDEVLKMKKENIQAAIQKKEKEALDTMNLNELRALNDDQEIPQPKEEVDSVPGEASSESSAPVTPPTQ